MKNINPINLSDYDNLNHIADYNYRDEVRQEIYELLTILTPRPNDHTQYRVKKILEAGAEMLDEYEREIPLDKLESLFNKKW